MEIDQSVEHLPTHRWSLAFTPCLWLHSYAYSYYLAMSTFTGMGDNDLSVDSSWAECLITSIFLLLSIILMSYILGTFTMLLMANDKRSKKFRERMTNLGAFNEERKLPRVRNS